MLRDLAEFETVLRHFCELTGPFGYAFSPVGSRMYFCRVLMKKSKHKMMGPWRVFIIPGRFQARNRNVSLQAQDPVGYTLNPVGSVNNHLHKCSAYGPGPVLLKAGRVLRFLLSGNSKHTDLVRSCLKPGPVLLQ